MRICLTSVFVDDQDKAERFYTEVLGLRVKDNVRYTDAERWLTVVSREDSDGVELVLHLADESARAFRQANREPYRWLIVGVAVQGRWRAGTRARAPVCARTISGTPTAAGRIHATISAVVEMSRAVTTSSAVHRAM
jgi:catechol 2,3-dioxygenase-like lactoylglutathione lyase family enzyme